MTESEILDLIRRKSETAHLDYKAGFEWKKDNKDLQLGLLRDMMAMANSQDGGTIILGVEDGTYNLVGISRATMESLDQTNIGQMLYSYSEPKLNFELQKARIDDNDIVVIRVSEFEDSPIICTESVCGKDPTKPILRRGAVYIRTTAAQTEEIASSEEMRQLLSRAMLKRGDELLRSIEQIIKGKPLVPTEETVNLYQAEITATDQWLIQVLQKGFLNSARWEVIAYPTQYIADRVAELPTLERLAKESQVSLRGWPFPYFGNRGETGMFNFGYQSYVDSNDIREGFRLYKSGLIVFKRAAWEDLRNARTEEGKRTLSFISAIYSLTEFLLFLKRFYESIATVENVHITVRLIGCRDRALASFEPLVHLPDWYMCQDESIAIEQDFKVVDLRASSEQIARRIARHIFHVFNWTDVSDDVLVQWQDKLLARVRQVRSS